MSRTVPSLASSNGLSPTSTGFALANVATASSAPATGPSTVRESSSSWLHDLDVAGDAHDRNRRSFALVVMRWCAE